ncbi:MAG: hypothetical protein JSV98_05225 [candidate division WOR-3 bacterium]|nr:MAG: hypothetical protein JSV98_05225 [candidate division WOR-3 bacterium]
MINIPKKYEWALTTVGIAIPIIFLILYANDLLFLTLGAIFLIAMLLLTAFSVERVFLLLAFYVAAFEVRGYLVYFPGMTIWYSWKISYPLFLLLIAYWAIHLFRSRERFVFNQMDKAVMVFLIIMMAGAIHGFLRGYDRKLVLYDFLQAPFFLGYFIFVYSPLKEKVRLYYDFLLFTAVFVGLQFIYAVTRFQAGFFLTRIVSEHIHIAQFAIPYVVATLIYSKNTMRKVLFAPALPILLLGVVFCQQRSLYASVGLSIVLLIALFVYSKRAYIKAHAAQTTRYLTIIAIFLALVVIVAQSFSQGKFLNTILSRLFIFLNIGRLNQDISWQIRWLEINDALQDLNKFWLFGQGFGASFITRCRYMLAIVVDQSYVYMIWKTGLVGLLSLLAMYYMLFKRGLSTLLKKITPEERIQLLTAIINTAGMMLIAFANVSIAHFRLMFVWAGLFGATEVIARRYDKIH